MPMALEPPPTAATVIGLAADGFGHLDQAFVADHGLEVPHHARIGSGPATVPMM